MAIRHAFTALTASLTLALAGCATTGAEPTADNPRPLTASEAERLALVRFVNHQRGRGALAATVPSGGHDFTVTGHVDWREHRGYAKAATTGADGTPIGFLVLWTLTTIDVHPNWTADLPAQPPPTGWNRRPLNARSNPVDAALLLVLNLAADRPDNAQLLNQSDARWLRAERLGDTDTMVVTGPSSAGPGTAGTGAPAPPPATDEQPRGRIRYWVDPEGVLLRLSAPLGHTGETATLDFPDHDVPPVPAAPAP
jgi:hypothetical protein